MSFDDTSTNPGGAWLTARLNRPAFLRYLEAVRSRWWLVALLVAISVGAAVAYVSVAHKQYTAQADLLVTPVSEDDANLVGLPLIRDTSDPSADVLTVAKLVDSRQTAERVAARIGGSPSALLLAVQATPVTESDVVAVQANAATPARAAAIANSFATQTLDQQTTELDSELNTEIPALKKAAKGLTAAEAASISAEIAELETLRAGSNPTISLSSSATPPAAPSSPKVALSLAGAVFAGVILSLLMIFGMQSVDARLRDEEQLRELFRLPLLARIPRQRSGREALTPDRLSPSTEGAFRNLRSLLTMRENDLGRGRAILVTGDNPGNGKTTVAINLAVALAAANKQVILIEGDMRRPGIGRSLQLRSPNVITDVLRGQVDLIDAVVWSRPFGPQLELLLADPADQAGADRASNEAIHRLVAEACSMADFVIIDAPPLPAVSEALAFADAADHVMVVARVGHSQVRRLNDLGEMLSQRGIVPLGLVLIGVAESDVTNYYYDTRPAADSSDPRIWGLIQRRAGEDPLAGDSQSDPTGVL